MADKYVFRNFQWTPDLETGISEIDRQHRDFLKLVDELLDKAIRGQGRGQGQFSETFSYLESYANNHFSLEEHVMDENKYPAQREHRMKHKEFRENLRILKNIFKTVGATDELSSKINYFLVNWFMGHVRDVDKKMCIYLKARRGGEGGSFIRRLKALSRKIFGGK